MTRSFVLSLLLLAVSGCATERVTIVTCGDEVGDGCTALTVNRDTPITVPAWRLQSELNAGRMEGFAGGLIVGLVIVGWTYQAGPH